MNAMKSGASKMFVSAVELAKFAAECFKNDIATKKHIKEKLKKSGKFTTEKNVSIVLEEINRQDIVREKRKYLGYSFEARPFFVSSKNWPRNILRLGQGATARRLEIARKDSIRRFFANAYRVSEHGSISVDLTNDPAEVDVSQYEYKSYDVYGGKFKGWGCRIQNTVITAPRRWRTRVQRRGLAVVDGMMTLDAARVQAEGCELFCASWIQQGRGTSVKYVSGYIARSGEFSYHALKKEEAVAGLKRKQRAIGIEMALDAGDDLSQMSQSFASAIVRIADAKAVGACDFGIRSWCIKTGLDYEAGSAPLSDVVSAYRAHPWVEVRATILRVLRRQRSSRRGAGQAAPASACFQPSAA